MGMRVKGPFPIRGPHAACRLLTVRVVSWVLLGCRKEMVGMRDPCMGMAECTLLGEPCRWQCPRHRLARSLEMMRWATVGLCSRLQGRAGPAGSPQGWLGGDFVPPHILASRQRF